VVILNKSDKFIKRKFDCPITTHYKKDFKIDAHLGKKSVNIGRTYAEKKG
jgi:hypothetical protein